MYGYRARSLEESARVWEELFRRRRVYQMDDTRPIEDIKIIEELWSSWSSTWLEENLTPQQKKKDYSSRSSIFNAYIKQNFGGKLFVSAVWGTGFSWLMDVEVSSRDPNAAKKVADGLVQWLSKVLEAIDAHKQLPEFKEAQRRSAGPNWELQEIRKERKKAQKNYA